MQTDIQQRVFDFILEELRCKPHEISLERSLNRDLGMDGDDAVEFFEAFATKFNVDLSELREEWERYFGPEGLDLFGLARGVFTLFTARQPGPILPMRIGRVVNAAETGHWKKLKDDATA
jgi:acyl carrier protein